MPTKHAAPPLRSVRQGARRRVNCLLPKRLIAREARLAWRVVCTLSRVPGKRLRCDHCSLRALTCTTMTAGALISPSMDPIKLSGHGTGGPMLVFKRPDH